MSEQVLRQNCISCVLGPLFKYGWVIGLPPVIITCNHKKSILRANVRSPKGVMCSCFLLTILMICSVMSYGLSIINDIDNSKSVFEVLLKVPSFSICLGSIFILLNIPLQSHKIGRMCELLQNSLESFRESKVVVLLTVKDIAHLKLYIYLPFLLWLSATTALILPIIFHTDKLLINTLEVIGTFVSFYIGAFVVFFVCYVYNLMRFLTKRCQYQLVCHLRNNLKFRYYNLNNRLTIVNNKFVNLNASESIAPYIRFNSQLVVASRLFNKSINPCLLTTVVLFIFAQAAIYFQYILRVVKNETIVFGWTLLILHIEWISSITLCTFFIVLIWKLEIMNNHMVSFLSKYPMSSLFKEEAMQLECYMRALKRHEIQLNGSDILICKFSVFGSVFSGIMMLISVAIQFILLKM